MKDTQYILRVIVEAKHHQEEASKSSSSFTKARRI